VNALPIKEDLRARICDRIVLLSGPILLLSATLIANGPLITPGRPLASLFTTAGLLFLAIAALRRRLPTTLKASLFLVLTLGLFMATQLLFGRQAPPSVVGAIAVLFSVVFFRPWVSVLVVVSIVAVTTLVQVTGLALHPLADPGHALVIKSSWTYKLVPILFGISYMLVIGGALINGYDHALRRLSDSEAGLEDALAERTEELQEALALALAREQEMQRIAFRDELTGLLSKHRLERFYQDIAADESLADVPHAIALVNIRDFSDINDSYGYAIGNIVLREVARLLLETCDRRDLVARLSADEFLIILRWARAQGSLERRLALLQQQLDRELYVAGHGIALRCAIGVANYPEDGRDLPAMYRAARRAWRRARDQGSHALAVFDAAQDGRGEHRLEMIEALRAALASNAIHLHFQPIVRLDDMRVVATEGLARWELDNGELRSPAEFLSLAEESGQMRALNQRNLAQVTALLGDWRTDPKLAPISVSFNLSARDLLDDTITEALAAVEHLQGKLTVEITESDLVNDVDALRTVIRRLRRRGIRFAIDDFGVGYSSLARLHQLEVDIVKLDGSFIADIEDRQESRDLVRAVIDIVHKLGAQVTAEYVQTAGQVALLRDMGCDFGQGSFVAHALGRDRFEHLIRQGHASETLKYQCC
jgi:diguanylate cyclase (GGDEF)-like protein